MVAQLRTSSWVTLLAVAQLVAFTTVMGAPTYTVDIWLRSGAVILALVTLAALRVEGLRTRSADLAVVFASLLAMAPAVSCATAGDFDGNAFVMGLIAVVTGALFPWGLGRQSILGAIQMVLLIGMWNSGVARPDGYAQLGVFSPATSAVALGLLLSWRTRRLFEEGVRETLALRAARDEIHALNTSLEETVRARTLQLEHALEDQRSFAYTVSHDLRQPLRHVDGYLRLFAEASSEAINKEQSTLLHRAHAALQRAGDMIDSLLQIARTGIGDVRRQDVDLSAMADDILDELRSAYPDRQVETRVAPGLRTRAEARLVKVVLQQLLANAWKFTRRRPEALIEVGSEPGGVIFVRDNGVGFDMEFAGKLFGAFQRLHGVEEFDGEGVGLTLAYRMVRRHGGRIWAQGRPQEGATFRFTLNP